MARPVEKKCVYMYRHFESGSDVFGNRQLHAKRGRTANPAPPIASPLHVQHVRFLVMVFMMHFVMLHGQYCRTSDHLLASSLVLTRFCMSLRILFRNVHAFVLLTRHSLTNPLAILRSPTPSSTIPSFDEFPARVC